MLPASLRLVVVFFCLVSTGHAQSVEFGRLRFGMTFSEIRAAMPEVAWTDVSPDAGQSQDQIQATAAVSFAGMPFDAKVYQGRDNSHRISFSHAEQVTDAAACEAKGIALVVDLEKVVGSLGWPVKTVTGEEVIDVGNGSKIMVSGWTKRFQPVPRNRFAASGTTGFGLRARGTHGEGADRINIDVKVDLDEHTCNLESILKRNVLW